MFVHVKILFGPLWLRALCPNGPSNAEVVELFKEGLVSMAYTASMICKDFE